MLKQKIKKVKSSIVAIGFQSEPKKMSIIGSGFCVGDNGKILSSAHLYNRLEPEHIPGLMAMVMIKQDERGLEYYRWFSIVLEERKNKDDKNDIVLFQIEGYEDYKERYKDMALRPLELGSSERVEVGDEVYFIGFPYAAQLINDGFGVTRIVNKGIISSIKQDGTDPSRKRNWFIVDAISNPGNSGCPLIRIDDNKVIGVMAITFRTKSKTHENLDIREPMHICAAKPISLAKSLLG